jgi:hypothetical protein
MDWFERNNISVLIEWKDIVIVRDQAKPEGERMMIL